ncbi:MAG TPA: CoA-transferase [Acetobacteraceae bacterium]|jgi:propionate CoA-transferase
MNRLAHPFAAARDSEHQKLASPVVAVRLIRDGDTIAVGGFAANGFSEAFALALELRFLAGGVRGLTLVYCASRGDGRTHGLNRLGHPGLVKRVIGGQWSMVPRLYELALANRIEGYSLPQGVIMRLFRDIAAGRPGHVTKAGLGTSVDPRNGGGRVNTTASEDLVSLVHIAGEDALFYRAFPIRVAIVHASVADVDGNSAVSSESLSVAQAARQAGGMVIVCADHIGTVRGTGPRETFLAGSQVDCVVPANPVEGNWETFAPPFDTRFADETLALPFDPIV